MSTNPEIESIHTLIDNAKDYANDLKCSISNLEDDVEDKDDMIDLIDNVISNLEEAYDDTLYYKEEFDFNKENLTSGIIEIFHLPKTLDVAMLIESKINEVLDYCGNNCDKY